MSAQTDYLRGQLATIESALNNQAARIQAVNAIKSARSLLAARDGLEATGKDLGALDAGIIASLYGTIKTAVDAVNANQITIPTLGEISAGIPPATP